MFRYLDIVSKLNSFLDMPFRYIDDIKAFDCQPIVCHMLHNSVHTLFCGAVAWNTCHFQFAFYVIAYVFCACVQIACAL